VKQASYAFATLFLMAAHTVAAEPLPWPATAEPDAKLEVAYAAKIFFEGPTWDPRTKKLYFTAWHADKTQILRLDEPGKAPVWMDMSRGANGTYLSNDGRLLAAQVNNVAIVSIGFGAEGPEDVRVLASGAGGVFGGPNDLCQTPRGDIYFTVPDFGKHKESTVYRVTPEGKVSAVIKDMELCNGIRNSIDGRTLYVADSARKHWRSYPVDAEGNVGEGKTFFEPKSDHKYVPDGLALDENGTLYLTGMGGIWVVAPDAKPLGFIPVPEFATNATFGGTDGKTLYITCADKLYSLKMNVRGEHWAK
jgi:gluconolactonase